MIKTNLITFIAGLIIGALVWSIFFKPKIEREVVETVRTTTDTVYVTHRDTVTLDRTRLVIQKDTVYLEPDVGYISSYSGTESFQYGKIDWNAQTTGELVGLEFIPEVDIPTITNEVERIKTIRETITPRGLYAGAMAGTNRNYKVSATYLDNKWMFDATYSPNSEVWSLGVKRKIW